MDALREPWGDQGGSPPGHEPLSLGGGECGSKPKLVAIGIAPLGVISIGIVPMGVVSIGVVPMGVVSLGLVGMGVINATVVGMGVLITGVNVMGVWWAGLDGMGPFRLGGGPAQVHHHHGGLAPGGGKAPGANLFAYPSRGEALRKARELGCPGVHPMGALWMPCERHP
ncbi:hypothetical protein [Cyanobium sp. Morenito 9A2]|uniref:hypothetical protein n=1 Tax=Cyanobium sp. Morenito 9A2 TaxID=2823718 RepID=UPI0020CB6C30|nr:hypothetical protein [Cyanobium sp. Morenito 9A2]MCP9850752.1 hypothetical protein [Cyanobium sp. Morenito 9A2]